MKTLRAMAAVGLGLLGSIGPLAAQPYGYRDRGDYDYRDRGDYGYRDRGRSRDDYDDRDRGYGRRQYGGFDAAEYLRCNPDVRRAIAAGKMESAEAHYRTFGRREGRRLSC